MAQSAHDLYHDIVTAEGDEQEYEDGVVCKVREVEVAYDREDGYDDAVACEGAYDV